MIIYSYILYEIFLKICYSYMILICDFNIWANCPLGFRLRRKVCDSIPPRRKVTLIDSIRLIRNIVNLLILPILFY